MTEYRQDDHTEGCCARCGQGLSNVTTAGTGYCEIHGWVHADWHMAREIAAALPSDRDPGDETDGPNLTPGVMTGEENDPEPPATDPRPDPRTHPEYWTE